MKILHRRRLRLSRRDRRVLLALLTDATNLSATTLAVTAQVSPWRVFQIIDRLEDANVVVTAREELSPGDIRPPRRYYRLTAQGRAWAHEALALVPAAARVEEGGPVGGP